MTIATRIGQPQRRRGDRGRAGRHGRGEQERRRDPQQQQVVVQHLAPAAPQPGEHQVADPGHGEGGLGPAPQRGGQRRHARPTTWMATNTPADGIVVEEAEERHRVDQRRGRARPAGGTSRPRCARRSARTARRGRPAGGRRLGSPQRVVEHGARAGRRAGARRSAASPSVAGGSVHGWIDGSSRARWPTRRPCSTRRAWSRATVSSAVSGTTSSTAVEQRVAHRVAAGVGGARQLGHRPLGVPVAQRQLLEADDPGGRRRASTASSTHRVCSASRRQLNSRHPVSGQASKPMSAGHEQERRTAPPRGSAPSAGAVGSSASPLPSVRRGRSVVATAAPSPATVRARVHRHGSARRAGAAGAGSSSAAAARPGWRPARPARPRRLARRPRAASGRRPGAGDTASRASHARASARTNSVTPPTMAPESLTALPRTAATTDAAHAGLQRAGSARAAGPWAGPGTGPGTPGTPPPPGWPPPRTSWW